MQRPKACARRGRGLLGLVAVASVLTLPLQSEGAKINRYTSMSGDFARLPHRFTTTDLDGTYFHPAGLVFGREGLGLELALQTTYNDFLLAAEGLESVERALTWPIPSFSAAYHRDRWAIGLHVGAVGGGGVKATGRHAIFEANRSFVVDAASAALPLFTDVALSESLLDAYSLYTGLYSSLAFRVNDQLSIAIGGKVIDYRGALTLRSDFDLLTAGPGGLFGNHLDLQARQSGVGFGWLVDLHLAPAEGLVIGLRYEGKSSIETRTDLDEQRLVNKDGEGALFQSVELLEDGARGQSDIPAMASLGVEYQLTSSLKVLSSFAYYFNRDAAFGPFLGFDITGKVDDDWEAGAGLEWQLNKDQLLSMGHLYFNSGHNDESRTLNRYTLDGHFIGFGGRQQLTDRWDLSLSLLLMLWNETEAPLDGSRADQESYVFGVESSFWF